MKKIIKIIITIYGLLYLIMFMGSSDIMTYRTINIVNNTGTGLIINIDNLDNIVIQNNNEYYIDIGYLNKQNIKIFSILNKDYTFFNKHINTIGFDYFKTVENFDIEMLKKNLKIEKTYFPIYYKTMINNQDIVITVK